MATAPRRGFEWLSKDELEALLPEDGVPEGLHYETLHDDEGYEGLTADEFEDWLRWGRYDQPLAQALLHFWQADVSVCGNDSIQDFFRLLLNEARGAVRDDGEPPASQGLDASTQHAATKSSARLGRRWLVEYMLEHCSLSVPLGAATARPDVLAAVEVALIEELAGVRVFVSHWRSSAAVFDDVAAEEAAADTVDGRLRRDVRDVVQPWPTIEAHPTDAWCDGRFVKAFPLEFPMGVADLHQERLRSDFTAAAWAQHLFRYFDGRFLRSSRGHRVVWAIFNTVLREQAHGVGSVVHKTSEQEVLTKERLQKLVAERQDLVRHVASFGAEVPTTPLHWKREGHHLEWCVRQLSWIPPWSTAHATDVLDVARRAVQRADVRLPPTSIDEPALDEPASPDDLDATASSRSESSNESHEAATQDGHASPTVPSAAPCTPVRRPGARASTPRSSPGERAFSPGDIDPTHPRRLWRRQAVKISRDHLGCGRTPAFWFTLNVPYNALHEIHRFHEAAATLAHSAEHAVDLDAVGSADVRASDATAAPDLPTAAHSAVGLRRLRSLGCAWVRENPDIVAFVHALRVELQVRLLMSEVVPPEPQAPFQFWLRFEYGANGNPHAHGLCYVPKNPAFESVVADADTRETLLQSGRRDAIRLRTVQEATRDIAAFFAPHVRESHPCKDLDGRRLTAPWTEPDKDATAVAPHHVDLLTLLDEVFASEDTSREPDLSRLRRLLAALIEDGQRHTSHGHHAPRFGADPCARKKRGAGGAEDTVHCRYLFPRPLVVPTDDAPGAIFSDPHRPGLQNLALPRNDTLINSFEEHLLLSNLGNIDWRPLINLWSVLEYLTKYTAKAGKPTKHVGALFEDVVHRIMSFEEEDGAHDLWRRAIMKFYNQMLANRDYSLLEVLHFGLRLPGVVSSLGHVRDVSVSHWTALRRGADLARVAPGDRCTARNKLELFGARSSLTRPSTVHVDDLRNISFYEFWRLYSPTRAPPARTCDCS